MIGFSHRPLKSAGRWPGPLRQGPAMTCARTTIISVDLVDPCVLMSLLADGWPKLHRSIAMHSTAMRGVLSIFWTQCKPSSPWIHHHDAGKDDAGTPPAIGVRCHNGTVAPSVTPASIETEGFCLSSGDCNCWHLPFCWHVLYMYFPGERRKCANIFFRLLYC